MKLITTKAYLLLIDEEAEIKENDIIYSALYGIGKIIKDYGGESTKTYRPLIAKFQNSNVQQEYGRDGVWQLGVDGATVAKNNCKKVIAYYPRTKKAKELDLPWLPNPFEEVDIEKIALKKLGYINDYEMTIEAWEDVNTFIRGYKAAQSKQLELLKRAIQLASDAENIEEVEEEIIQSLFTQQLPKEFIPEFVQTKLYIKKENLMMYEAQPKELQNPHTTNPNDIWELKTITNSKGKKELVGIYKY